MITSKICTKCGVEKKIVEFYKYKDIGRSRCKKCTNEDAFSYRHRNPEKTRVYAREYARRYRLTHKYPKRNTVTDRAYKARVKREILSYYSGGIPSCALCGYTNMVALSIDHINGGGNEHRKRLYGGNRGGGYAFYIWLRKNEFPKEFRVLCMNCQWIEKERLKTEERNVKFV